MYYKSMDKEAFAHDVVIDKQIVPITPTPDAQQNSAIDSRLATVERGYKLQQHRLWLLVLAHNENAHLLERMDKAHHRVDNRGFITFDSGWNLNKLPETMKLTPEQREMIQSGPK
jgi:hypothetical protein